jgi:hypothetical protein
VAYGPPDDTLPGIYQYANGTLWVSFEEGNVWRLERRLHSHEQLSLAAARQASPQFMPTDSEFIRTYARQQGEADETIVDVYHSNWLRTRFPAESEPMNNGLAVSYWGMAQPGTFFVHYTMADVVVTAYTISVGDAP